MTQDQTKASAARPTGDELRAIVRSFGGSTDAASPQEYVLAGWKAALASQPVAAAPGATIKPWDERIPKEGSEKLMRDAMRAEIADLRAALAQQAEAAPAPTAEPLHIELGYGKIEIGQGHHTPSGGERLPAILFGRNGAGAVGVETDGDRFMAEGECIVAVTFANPGSLDVLAEKVAELRARIWPDTAPVGHSAATDEQQDKCARPFAAPASQHEAIVGAVARGWCAPANQNKVMDEELAFAIVVEVEAMLASRFRAQGGNTSNNSGNSNIVEWHSAATAEPTEGAQLYRKTALVSAEQFLPGEGKIPAGVISDGNGDPRKDARYSFVLDTKEGRHTLRNGDYICTGPVGEKWNVERSIFESTYELAAPPTASGGGADLSAAMRLALAALDVATTPLPEDRQTVLRAQAALRAALAAVRPAPTDGHKNLHRLLCERFDYLHDEKDWSRDELSLIEHIAARVAGVRPAQADEASQAARDVLAERRRQVEAEGWTPEHDDEHSDGQMAGAAACYAVAEIKHWARSEIVKMLWPWSPDWWKPSDERRNLVKAGALILADIERIDRAALSHPQHGGGK